MLADLNVARAEQTAAELRTTGAQVATYGIDLARVAEISGLVKHTVRELGGLDVLVNNAGVEFGRVLLRGRWRNLGYSSECESPCHVLHHPSHRGLDEGPRWGSGGQHRVRSGAIFSPRYIPYTVSKSGVRGPTSVIAVALAPHGIRVNAVAPGWCNTAMNKTAADATVAQERLKLIPLHRIGEPEEMAEAVLFLASPAATYVTGQTFTVDGGWTLGAPPS